MVVRRVLLTRGKFSPAWKKSIVVSVFAVLGDVEASVLILARDPQWRDQADDPENDQGRYPGVKNR